MHARSFLLAILIAGLVTGLLGNLPILNLINCALCLWVWFGGALAVLLYRSFEHGQAAVTTGQGAGLGALAGLIGAVFGVLVFAVTSPLSLPIMNALARSFGVEGDIPFRSSSIGEVAVTAFIFLVVDSVLYPIFGALGGVIAAALTKGPRMAAPG